VNALAGPIQVGNNDVTSGFAGSDVLDLRAANQIPDALAAVTVTSTGRFNFNGFSETIGQATAQNALSLQAGSTVDLGGGTLTLNGNLTSSAATGPGCGPRSSPRG